jgi:bifunctional non-homologous end joining protein LigD
LRKQFDRLAQAQSPFGSVPKLRPGEKPVWVRPELVAQVRFAEWTESGILRQPLFLGLREDKAARDVRKEKPDVGGSRSNDRKLAPAAVKPKPARSRARAKPSSLALTNPQRVLFPADGVTKQQLAEYYEAVAPVLWPHLRQRPVIARACDECARSRLFPASCRRQYARPYLRRNSGLG